MSHAQATEVALETGSVPGRDNSRAAWTTAAALLLLAALSGFALLSVRTPAPAPADSAPGTFSAERALVHLGELAREPRPTGSQNAAAARRYLVRVLTDLGLDPAVSTRTACRPAPAVTTCGSVANVSAMLTGTDPTGTIVLVAHYDSVPGGPGAADDGYGVVTAVEVARAVTAGRPLRNNVLLLFTDGEEAGLLGARAALDSGRLPPADETVILNLEARGTSGPVVGFETGDDNAQVVDALRGEAPIATSFADEVYRLLPNETDFLEFRAAGYTGINLAVVGGSARYHTVTDNVANADPRSIQDLGDVTLSATRALSAADLGGDRRRVTYFPYLGMLVSYPAAVGGTVAVLAVLAAVVATVVVRRRGIVRLSRAAATTGSLLAALLLTGVLGFLSWILVTTIRPHHVGFVLGDPYRPMLAYVGLAAVAAAAAVAWWRISRQRVDKPEAAVAVVWVLAVLTIAAAVLAPGAGYLFSLSCLAGAVAVAAAAWRPADPVTRTVTWLLPIAAAVPLYVPVAAILFPALGLASAAVPMIVVALLAAVALAGLTLPRRWRHAVTAVSVALLVLGATSVVLATVRDEPDTRHPELVSMLYAYDADRQAAYWLSPYPVPHSFVDQHIREPVPAATADFPSMDTGAPYRWGRAAAVPVPTPAIQLLDSAAVAAGRRVRIRVATDSPEAVMVALYADTGTATVVEARLAGETVRPPTNLDDPWDWAATFFGPVSQGVDLELTLSNTDPIRLRAVAHSPGLPAQAMVQPMPPSTAGARHPAMYTLAVRGSVL